MQLGVFSISLNVKDIKASRNFYARLGFIEFGGDITQNWLIMKNANCIIGLFQGIIPRNTLTWSPGWDENAQTVPAFTDIRQIQKKLKADGLHLITEADENTSGPASFTLEDPDGNPILFDQYV